MAPATKATHKRLEANIEAFNARYADPKQWGEDRWFNFLYPALAQPTTYCAVINRYAVTSENGRKVLSDSEKTLEMVELPRISDSNTRKVSCYQWKLNELPDARPQMGMSKSSSATPFPAPKPSISSGAKLLTHWNMDAASVLTASMLDVQPDDRVLDLCAAPGGKSVVLAQSLFPQLYQQESLVPLETGKHGKGCLHINEFDASRCKRLTANMKSYLPPTLFPTPENPQAPVRILDKDLSLKTAASTLPLGVSGYNKVLVDAPCSSERHIIHAHEKARSSGHVADEMLNWKASHVTTLVRTQAGLLQTAIKATSVGGKIVYATCALGYEENDGVVEKVLETLRGERKKARRDGLKVEDWDVEFSLGSDAVSQYTNDPVIQQMTEGTKYGRIALPDHGGWGPLYFCVMVKVNRPKRKKTSTALKAAIDKEKERLSETERD